MRISDWSSDGALPIFQLRAGRVAEGVARAAIALAEHGIEVAGVLVAEAELAPDPLVDILGQRLGHLDAEAVQVEVVLIAVILEPRARHVGGALAHGDALQAEHVALPLGDARPEASRVGDEGCRT